MQWENGMNRLVYTEGFESTVSRLWKSYAACCDSGWGIIACLFIGPLENFYEYENFNW